MTKSASKNRNADHDRTTLNRGIAVFLIAQAVFFLGLRAYYHPLAGALPFSAVLAWAAASLVLAILALSQRRAAKARPDDASDKANIFGRPGKDLDLPGLCALLKEGVALTQHGRVIYVNPALSYLLAVQEEEILGASIRAYVHPEDAEIINLDGGGGQARAALRLNTSLGDVRWVICSLHNVDWQDERAILLLFENIGPLHQAQTATEKLEQQMQMLMEHSALGIALFDSLGRLKSSNTAWNAIWSSVIGDRGLRFNILQHSFLPNTVVKNAIQQAFDKKNTQIPNFEHTAPWGEVRWLNLSFHPMLDPMGRLLGVGMIHQDITEQIRGARRENELSAQLAALRAELSAKPF